MTTNVFTKVDLDNIDYDETLKANCGFFNFKKLYGYAIKFALKDGRIFCCEQNLAKSFTIHSDKYGDVEGDFWLKMAAEIVNDNDKFVIIVKNFEDVADFVQDYSYDVPDAYSIRKDGIIHIIERYYAGHAMPMLRKLAEMGLDENNKLVTIKPATKTLTPCRTCH